MTTQAERATRYQEWLVDTLPRLQKEAGIRLHEILSENLEDFVGAIVNPRTKTRVLMSVEQSIAQWTEEMESKGYKVNQRFRANVHYDLSNISIQFPPEVTNLMTGNSGLLHIPSFLG